MTGETPSLEDRIASLEAQMAHVNARLNLNPVPAEPDNGETDRGEAQEPAEV